MTINQHNGSKLTHNLNPTPEPFSKPAKSASPKFDQAVILQQPATWSRAIVWAIVSVTTATIIWSFVAKIEEAIPAQGKLEPQGAVKEIQAPVGGVVKSVQVEDGQRVKQGDSLISFDPTAAEAQQKSLDNIRTALQQENQFYRTQLAGAASPQAAELQAAALKLPAEITSLTKSRAALMAENQLYRTQAAGGTVTGVALTSDQLARLQSSRDELNSRVAAADLEVRQLEKQLIQNEIALANAKDSLAVNQRILDDIEPLYEEGGIARVQYLNQRQEVRSGQAEIQRLNEEQKRLQFAIAQANENMQNTVSLSRKDLLTQIAENEKRIAEIDGQLTKAIVENEKRIDEINSQLSQTQLTLKYQEIKSPTDGVVFDLKAGPGFVANTSEPILKIVPVDNLVAKVYITNRDIGFVREGMPVDVRIDSFPFNEFGDVKGNLIWIGSDALPPDEIRPYYTFPAKIRLDQQTLMVNGRPVVLQSGMSVSTNIKVRKRTVASIFINLFAKQLDGLKSIR